MTITYLPSRKAQAGDFDTSEFWLRCAAEYEAQAEAAVEPGADAESEPNAECLASPRSGSAAWWRAGAEDCRRQAARLGTKKGIKS
jgi:hypothetical protein